MKICLQIIISSQLVFCLDYTMDLSALSVEETAAFVSEKLNLPDIARMFAEQDVDGSVLLLLTTSTIRDFLPSVTLGQCVKLFNRLEAYTVEQQRSLSVMPSTERIAVSSRTDVPPPSPPRTPSPTCNERTPGTSPQTPRRQVPVPREFPIDQIVFTPPGTHMIRTGEVSIVGKTAITNAVVTLIQTFSNSDGYASYTLKRMAATSLLYKYPSLTMGMDLKNAVEAWHRAFTQKLTNWRKRGKVEDPSIEDNRKKYRAQVEASAVQRPLDNVTRRRHVSSDVSLNAEEEDEQEQMKQTLLTEMSKPARSRNVRFLDETTHQTFQLRRKFVLQEKPHVQTFLKDWPSLKIETIMFSEFARIVPGVAAFSLFSAELRSALPKLMAELRLKASAQTKSHPLSVLVEKIPHVERTSPEYDADLNVIGAVCGLAYLLPTTTKKGAQPHRYIIDVCPSRTTVEEIKNALPDRDQPFLVVFGDLNERQRCVVFVDKTPVCSVTSVESALYAVMAMYYILDMHYCRHVASSLECMQHMWFGLPMQKPQAKVRDLIRRLQK